jgi:tetratricopeptide (TPR) repeat protein
MKLPLKQRILAFGAGLLLATQMLAADTNTSFVTCDEMTSSFQQVQEQIRATQSAIAQNQDMASAASQSNALALAARLESLEQTVSKQRASESDSWRKTQQLTLVMAGLFGLAGLGVMLLMVYFQWRAIAQLAPLPPKQLAAVTNGDAVHQLAAPGRATVEASAAQLLNVVGRLEQRIQELEQGQKLLPEAPSAKPVDLLVEGQKYLEANLPLKALECFDAVLGSQPGRAEAMVKRSTALEQLGRDDEALAGYNRAIAADPSLVIAHLHKGGLLNRLRRYDEALNCYEQALSKQDKR